MKLLLSSLLALLIAVGASLLVLKDNGYILIGYQNWTVEGSLAFFILLNLAVFALLYLVLRALARLWSVPERYTTWRRRREARKARRTLTQGLLELSEGHWRLAEKSLMRHVGSSETPLLNYLAAARSAQNQGAHERRDHYLHLAHESMPAADIAVGLTQAELQIAHQQYEQALATLMHLRSVAPKHTYVLKLLVTLYERLGDWKQLRDLLPELHKRRALAAEELGPLEIRVYQALLAQAGSNDKQGGVARLWADLPRSLRTNETLVSVYARQLIAASKEEQAEQLLYDAIRRNWSPGLVAMYGTLEIKGSTRQLTVAESWLQEHQRDPVLLLALGRLCLRNRLWGKARSYLEASIGAEPRADAYRELGALLEKRGDRAEAMECYRKGLELTTAEPTPVRPDAIEKPSGDKGRLEAPDGKPGSAVKALVQAPSI